MLIDYDKYSDYRFTIKLFQINLTLEINMVNTCILLGMLGLKLQTINKCLSSAPIKCRSQCYASLHCDEYTHLRTWHVYNAGKTLYEDQSCVIECLLAHLSWKLKWAFLITCRPSSVCPSVNFSHFHLLLQNHWANFNQTWHKASLGEGDSSLIKWRAPPFSKGR